MAGAWGGSGEGEGSSRRLPGLPGLQLEKLGGSEPGREADFPGDQRVRFSQTERWRYPRVAGQDSGRGL